MAGKSDKETPTAGSAGMVPPGMPGSSPNPFSNAAPSRLPGGLSSPVGLPSEDDEFELDMTDVTLDGFFVPAGFHPAFAIGLEKETSKQNNPMLVWEFKIFAGESVGKTLKSWTALTANAMWKVAENLMAVGLPGTGSVVKFKRSDVLDKPVILEITEEDYMNPETKVVRKTSKVSKVHPPSDEVTALYTKWQKDAAPPA